MHAVRLVLASLTAIVGVAATLGGLAAGPAAAASLPTSPVGKSRVTIKTASGWTIEQHGPKSYKRPTITQLVVRQPTGAVDALLYPEAQIPDFCDPFATSYRCLPLSVLTGGPTKYGTKGVLVTDQNGDGVPEVSIPMFTGGAHCCVVVVGYWRDAASGAWKSDTVDTGSAGSVSTKSGRIETANPAFEGLDWAYAETSFYFTWSRLVPGVGWVDATTRADHLHQIALMTRTIKRYSKPGDANGVVKSARAIRIGHRAALGQTAIVAKERNAYRRAYGARSLRLVDQAIKG